MAGSDVIIFILLLCVSIAFLGCCILFFAFCLGCLISEVRRLQHDDDIEHSILDESMVD